MESIQINEVGLVKYKTSVEKNDILSHKIVFDLPETSAVLEVKSRTASIFTGPTSVVVNVTCILNPSVTSQLISPSDGVWIGQQSRKYKIIPRLIEQKESSSSSTNNIC